MKIRTVLWMFFLLFSGNVVAQPHYEQIIEASKKTIDSIMEAEKIVLKAKIKTIDQMLDNKEISWEIAQRMKEETTLATHGIIQKKIRPETQKIAKLIRKQADAHRQLMKQEIEKNDADIRKKDSISEIADQQYKLAIRKLDSLHNEKTDRKLALANTEKKFKTEYFKTNRVYENRDYRRVQGGFNFAIAFHNMRSDAHFSNDKFRIWGSKSVELGYYNNVRLLKNNNLLHLNYGLSWMMNKLKMKGDDYFVNNHGITEIQPYKVPVIKSKFKTHYLILPINLEFDFTPSYTYRGRKYYPIHDSFRVGVGVYGGLLLSNKQKVKYIMSGSTHKELNFNNMNINEWTYGLSAHMGLGNGVFYARYSLVPLFRNNPINEYPFSIGMRWGG